MFLLKKRYPWLKNFVFTNFFNLGKPRLCDIIIINMITFLLLIFTTITLSTKAIKEDPKKPSVVGGEEFVPKNIKNVGKFLFKHDSIFDWVFGVFFFIFDFATLGMVGLFLGQIILFFTNQTTENIWVVFLVMAILFFLFTIIFIAFKTVEKKYTKVLNPKTRTEKEYDLGQTKGEALKFEQSKESLDKKSHDSKLLLPEEFNKFCPAVLIDEPYDSGGTVTRSEIKKGRLSINLDKRHHQLLIGSSGVGKSRNVLSVSIVANAQSSKKPTMIITDPSGELYKITSEALKKLKYNVKVLVLAPQENTTIKTDHYDPMTEICKYWFTDDKQAIAEEKLNNFVEQVLPKSEQSHANTYFEANAQNLFKECIRLSLNMDLWDIIRNRIPAPPKIEQLYHTDRKEYDKGLFSTIDKTSLIDIKANMIDIHVWLKTVEDVINREPSFEGGNSFTKIKELLYENSSEPLENCKQKEQSFLTQATQTFDSFLNPTAETIIQKAFDYELFDNITNTPTAVYMISNASGRTETNLLASLFINDYRDYLGRIGQSMGGRGQKGGAALRKERPVWFCLEEFATFPSISLLPTGIRFDRKWDIFYTLCYQNKEDLKKQYPQDFIAIEKNCSLSILSETGEAAEGFSKMGGDHFVAKTSSSMGLGKGESAQRSFNLEREPVVPPKRFNVSAEDMGWVGILDNVNMSSKDKEENPLLRINGILSEYKSYYGLGKYSSLFPLICEHTDDSFFGSRKISAHLKQCPQCQNRYGHNYGKYTSLICFKTKKLYSLEKYKQHIGKCGVCKKEKDEE